MTGASPGTGHATPGQGVAGTRLAA